MAQDHFKTPPDPERGYKNPQKSQKSLKVRAKPAKTFILFSLWLSEARAAIANVCLLNCMQADDLSSNNHA